MPLERSDKQPQPTLMEMLKAGKFNSAGWQEKRNYHSLFASGIAAASFVEDIAESPARRGCPDLATVFKEF